MKRPKKEPDPDGLGDYGNSNSVYSHYNNGNEIYYFQLFVIAFDYEGFNSSTDEKA